MQYTKITAAFRGLLCAGVSIAAIDLAEPVQAQDVAEHAGRETIVVTGERDLRTISGTKSQVPLIETP